jgi:hypothetical protein
VVPGKGIFKKVLKSKGKLKEASKSAPKTDNVSVGSKQSQKGTGSDKSTAPKKENRADTQQKSSVENTTQGSTHNSVPEADGGFTADLSKTKAKSRSGHRNAGNKQLHDKMKSDPAFRAEMEKRYGSDVFDRTSTNGSGRRNPEGTEWDHSSSNPNDLDLRTKDNHRQKTSAEGRQGGGWKRFHRD